jgi:hypothetical protein
MNANNCSVWLYGSVARGDADQNSDFDVLFIGDYAMGQGMQDPRIIPKIDSNKISQSHYTWTEIFEMSLYGSLFLHHLRLEGKCLYEDSKCKGVFRSILNNLVPYQKPSQDVLAFETAIADVVESLNNSGSLLFELSILGTVFRHAAILGCYISGLPTFGRTRPVINIVGLWSLDKELLSKYETLYNYRLSAVRGIQVGYRPTLQEAFWWLDQIAVILSILKEKSNEYEAKL